MMRWQSLLRYKKIEPDNVKVNAKHMVSLNGRPIEVIGLEDAKEILGYTSQYHNMSNCTKTQVACLLYNKDFTYVAAGVNYVMGVEACLTDECKKDYGTNPAHRHTLCQAVHSERVALKNWYGGTASEQPYYAFVTRYPCKDCLLALATLGVQVVYFSATDSSGNTAPIDVKELSELSDMLIYQVI